LYESSLVQVDRAVREVAYDRAVVTDEQVREPELLLETGRQVQDAGPAERIRETVRGGTT